MKIQRINVVDDEYVYLSVDTLVDVLKRDANGVLQKEQANEFSMSRKDLSRQLQNINEDLEMLAAINGGLHQKELVLLLTGAEVDVDSKFHVAGEVVGNYTYQFDTLERALSNLQLTPRAAKVLDKALSL